MDTLSAILLRAARYAGQRPKDIGMFYVYLLESRASPDQRYVGLTTDLKQRFAEHNAGRSPHTSKFVPWRLVTYVAFSDQAKAAAFVCRPARVPWSSTIAIRLIGYRLHAKSVRPPHAPGDLAGHQVAHHAQANGHDGKE